MDSRFSMYFWIKGFRLCTMYTECFYCNAFYLQRLYESEEVLLQSQDVFERILYV